MQAIEIQIYGRKKHPFTGYPAAKHSKHGKFAITDMREKPFVRLCGPIAYKLMGITWGKWLSKS